jgi:hypothetical protein
MLGTAALASSAAHWLSFGGVLLCASVVLLLSVPLLTKAPPSPPQAIPAASRG